MHEFVRPCAKTVTGSPSPSTSTCRRVPSREASSGTTAPKRFDEVPDDDHDHREVAGAEQELVAAGAVVADEVQDRHGLAGADPRRGPDPGPPATVASGDGRPR